MADPLDCPGDQRFIHIIRIVLYTNGVAKESVGYTMIGGRNGDER